MNKTINGKLYDTDTATHLISTSVSAFGCIQGYDVEATYMGSHKPNQNNSEDPTWYFESLYITDDGDYFFHVKGNKKSPYSIRVGNSKIGVETILLPNGGERRVKEWCAEKFPFITFENILKQNFLPENFDNK